MLAVNQQVDIAGLAQRDLAVGHLCEQWSFEERDGNVVLFEKLVDAQLFADQVQHVLRIRNRLAFQTREKMTGNEIAATLAEVFVQQREQPVSLSGGEEIVPVELLLQETDASSSRRAMQESTHVRAIIRSSVFSVISDVSELNQDFIQRHPRRRHCICRDHDSAYRPLCSSNH